MAVVIGLLIALFCFAVLLFMVGVIAMVVIFIGCVVENVQEKEDYGVFHKILDAIDDVMN